MKVKDIQIGETYLGLKVLQDLGGKGTNHRMLVQCVRCGKEYGISAYKIGVSSACASCAQMKPDKDITGKRVGRLTVVGYHHTKKFAKGHPHTMWKCVCDCGNEVILDKTVLTGNNPQQSCGCTKWQTIREKNTIHGGCRTRLYNVWNGMKERCYNSNNTEYHNYGGRGIRVCDEWLNNFPAFRDWAINSGYDPKAKYGKTTIDRIDVNGNYEPSNCRWVDSLIQANNTRTVKRYTINGATKTLTEWCNALNLKRTTVSNRLHKGWDILRAFEIKQKTLFDEL